METMMQVKKSFAQGLFPMGLSIEEVLLVLEGLGGVLHLSEESLGFEAAGWQSPGSARCE